MPSEGRRSLRAPLAALAVGLGAGMLVTTLRHRTAQPVAYLDRGASAQVADRWGQAVSVPGDGGLRGGQTVRAGAGATRITLAHGGSLDLAPHARLALTAGGTARLEAGVAIVDTTRVMREVRIETPAGQVVLTTARVELRAGLVLPSAEPGRAPAIAYLQVEEGFVRLESGGRSMSLEAGEAALALAGRPPLRRPDTDQTAGLIWPPAVAGEDATPPPLAPPPSTVAVPVPVPVPLAARGGSISGVVEMEGTPAPADTRGPACAAGGAPPWSVAGGRVAGAYVYLSSVLPGIPMPPPPPIEASQQGCAVMPRILAVLVGQQVTLAASDGAAHEVRVTHDAEVVATSRLGPDGLAAAWTPSREGVFALRCQLHPEAVGVVAVSSHPFFAVTGSDGRFVIPNVPAGHHTLTAWHERGGEKSLEVVVSTGHASEVLFRYAGDPGLAVAPVAGAPAAGTATMAALTLASPAAEPIPPTAPPIPAEIAGCQIAVAGSSPVARACSEGGVARAAELMKQIVNAARARGVRVRCHSCHTDLDTHALAPAARERLDSLLAAPSVVTTFVSGPRLARPTAFRRGGRQVPLIQYAEP
jgi:hypothetical protein